MTGVLEGPPRPLKFARNGRDSSFSQTGSALLFHLLSKPCDHTRVAITSNLGVCPTPGASCLRDQNNLSRTHTKAWLGLKSAIAVKPIGPPL